MKDDREDRTRKLIIDLYTETCQNVCSVCVSVCVCLCVCSVCVCVC